MQTFRGIYNGGKITFAEKDLNGERIESGDCEVLITFLDDSLVRKLFPDYEMREGNKAEGLNLYKLTKRQKEVLMLVKQGLPNKEIAAKLQITEGSVRNRLSEIYKRLGTHNKIEAINKAEKFGLLD